MAAVGLTAGYNGVPVVHGVDLEVSYGEMVLVAGPNGAGKSTTLMTMTGAITPLSGQIHVDEVATTKQIHQRVCDGLGVVTEQRTIFSALTTIDNLRLGKGTVQAALDQFPELRRFLNVKAGLLSGGEQQILALARVLAAKPRSIVVDELSFGLAPRIVSRLLKALRSAADGGAAVLVVEQHVRLCLSLADRVYFMHRGSVVDSGAAQEFGARSDEQLAKLYL